MASPVQYQKYREQLVVSLTPGEQITLLFEQAAVNISRAIKCINKNDICTAHNSIIKAQRIYSYLSDTLDLNFEISKELFALYEFIQDRLAEANIKKDTGILDQVLGMTRDFKDTWKKAEVQSRAYPPST